MNLLLETDSYKLTHWNQYPDGTKGVYSYLEARRPGAVYDSTVFFGLQPILDRLAEGFDRADVHDADDLADLHFGQRLFNDAGWHHMLDKHNGRLPLRIKAVPEGSVVPTGNVLMTVENTDEEFPWLTNYVESLLLHVWYPTTVATVSYHVKQMLKAKLAAAGADDAGLPFMLHDFGFRGATTTEAAAIGGAGHLVNFMGTDTLAAMALAIRSYGADPASLAFSVPATEHSVMTALGRAGEAKIVLDLLDQHPQGILSVVADSFDIYKFVQRLAQPEFKSRICGRDGIFVVRPDSTTVIDNTPEQLCVRLLGMLWEIFGGTTTPKGYRVLDPHVRLLWGDGIDPMGIEKILDAGMTANYSPENFVFGMGGGLLQKVNRDTQRFAFKCSAQRRNGVWVPVDKETYGKRSKSGRLKLIRDQNGGFQTVPEASGGDDVLRTVFEDGEVLNRQTFQEIRDRAA